MTIEATEEMIASEPIPPTVTPPIAFQNNVKPMITPNDKQLPGSDSSDHRLLPASNPTSLGSNQMRSS